MPARSASTSARAPRTWGSASRSRARRSPTSRAGGLTADELERAKESVKGRMLLALESTSSRMSRLGRAVLSGSEILSLDEVAARVDAVTPRATSRRSRRELFAPERFSTAGIGPDDDRFRAAVGGEVALLEAVA